MDAESETGGSLQSVASLADAVERFSGILNGKPTLAEGLGIDRLGLEGLYGAARNEYAAGRYAEALPGFEVLCLYDHLNADYWLALGRCRQMLGNYFGAGSALALAAEHGAKPDADLRLDVVECMIAAGEPEIAEAAMRRLPDGAGEAWTGRLKLLKLALDNLRADRRGGGNE